MKNIILFSWLAALLLSLPAMTHAQTWTASAPEDGGTYYLYNVGKQQWLDRGEDYGTRACATYGGMVFDLIADGDNFYVHSSLGYLGTDGYLNKSNTSSKYVSWTFTPVEGQENVYTICTSTDSQYLYARNDRAYNSLGSLTGDEMSYWKLIKQSDREDISTASPAHPVDVTWRLQNQNFIYYTGEQTAWLKSDNTPWKTEDGSNVRGGLKDNPCAEVWNNTFDIHQTLTGLPNGLYQLRVQGFYRTGVDNNNAENAAAARAAGNEQLLAKYYINNTEGTLCSIFDYSRYQTYDTYYNSSTGFDINGTMYYVPNSMDRASACFLAGEYECDPITALVTDGTLTVGFRKTVANDHDWTIFDNVRLTFVEPAISVVAEELPASGDMVADKWYYVTIPLAGSYSATATTLSDIVYTTDGDGTLAYTGTVSDHFDATDNSLSGTRYYIKSTTANRLVIAAQSYTYVIGTPTPELASGSYLQSLTNFTFTFESTATNDPSGVFQILDNTAVATLKQSETTVTTGTLSLEGTALTSSFSNVTLQPGNTYTITIPAGAVGYNAENANAEYVYTFNTPLVFDGIYYLYFPHYDGFIGGGSAIIHTTLTNQENATLPYIDKYGIPIRWEVGTDGYSTLHFIDNDTYLRGTNWTFNEGTIDNATKFMVFEQEVSGTFSGYELKRPSSGNENLLYVRAEASSFPQRVASNGSISGRGIDYCTWQFWTKAEHDAYVAGYAAKNKTNVATSAGVANLDAYLATLSPVDVSSVIGTTSFGKSSGNWTYTAIYNKDDAYPKYRVYGSVNECARIWGATGTYSNTIAAASLPAGVYKLTVGGYQRHASEELDMLAEANGYGAMSPAYLDVNGQQVAFKTWCEMNQTAETAGQTPTYRGQSPEQAAQFIADGYADVSVYFYHDGVSDINIKIEIPCWRDDCYVVFNNVRLTQYVPSVTISENDAAAPEACDLAHVSLVRAVVEGYNSVCVPFDMTVAQVESVFGEGAEVYEFSDEGENGQNVSINFTRKATATIEANVPVLVKAPAAIAAAEREVGNVVIASSVDPAVAGTYFDFVGNYVTGSVVQANDYYISQNTIFKSQGKAKQKSTRAYLRNRGTAEEVKGLFFFDETATGIMTIDNGQLTIDNGAVYDLQGRRVDAQHSTLNKGIYIINGKKVFVK